MRSFLKSKIYLETNGPGAMTLRSAELFASREPGCLELWSLPVLTQLASGMKDGFGEHASPACLSHDLRMSWESRESINYPSHPLAFLY